MKLHCPHCAVEGSTEDSYIGRKVKCPKCNKRFVVEQGMDLEPIVAKPQTAEIDLPDEVHNSNEMEDLLGNLVEDKDSAVEEYSEYRNLEDEILPQTSIPELFDDEIQELSPDDVDVVSDESQIIEEVDFEEIDELDSDEINFDGEIVTDDLENKITEDDFASNLEAELSTLGDVAPGDSFSSNGEENSSEALVQETADMSDAEDVMSNGNKSEQKIQQLNKDIDDNSSPLGDRQQSQDATTDKSQSSIKRPSLWGKIKSIFKY